MHNIRLIIAVITSLLDEALILVLLLWGLPKLGVELPIPVVVLIVILFAIFAVTTFKLGTRALKMKPLAGLTDMTGVEGLVMKKINPVGLVKIDAELWEAKSAEGPIETGTPVIVISQKRLRLVVKRKQIDSTSN